MHNFKWIQFFAEGGAAEGGEGESSNGVTSGVPGRSLEDLGVPSKLAERHRNRTKGNAAETVPEAQQAQDKAAETSEAKTTTMSWDDFMAVPENNAKMQKMMSDRLKRQGKDNDDYMSALSPALELLAAKYGISPDEKGRYDPEALSKAVTDDDSYYEDKAVEMGVDTETAKRIATLENENRRNAAAKEATEAQAKAEAEAAQRDAMLREHFAKMQVQANSLREIFPDFDLQRELQNPDFMKRTSPEVGMSVEDAFYSIHHGQIMERQASDIAQRAKTDVTNSIRSGRSHPKENGGNSVASTVGTPDFSKMTSAERRAFIMKARPPK